MNLPSNKAAFAIGVSSEISYATAKLFDKEGARIAVARRQAELDTPVEEITQEGGNAIGFAEAAKGENVAKALGELASGRFGGLDIAFNNAGAALLAEGGVLV